MEKEEKCKDPCPKCGHYLCGCTIPGGSQPSNLGVKDGDCRRGDGQEMEFERLLLDLPNVPTARPASAPLPRKWAAPTRGQAPRGRSPSGDEPLSGIPCILCGKVGHLSSECDLDDCGRPKYQGHAPSAPPGKPPGGSRTPPGDPRKCHRCGKTGHLAWGCPCKGGNRWEKKASEIGKSLRNEEDRVAGAIDAAHEVIDNAPLLEEVRDMLESDRAEKQEEKEKKEEEDAELKQADDLQKQRDKLDVGGFRVSWRESNGDSPLGLGGLAFCALTSGLAAASWSYLGSVVGATTRLANLPAMLILTPFVSRNISGLSLGKSIFQVCVVGATAAMLMVGIDYVYCAYNGLRTRWAGGNFTSRRKNPIKREIFFRRWGSPCPVDRRPDYATVVEGIHDPLLAVVAYTTSTAWSSKTKERTVSMEILSQIAHHANMTHMVSDEISAVKLDHAAGKIATVKFNRYTAHLTTENVISETARLAHSVRMAQLYRLERDELSFYRPSSQ